MQLKSVLGSLSLQLIAESFFLEQQFMKKINSPWCVPMWSVRVILYESH